MQINLTADAIQYLNKLIESAQAVGVKLTTSTKGCANLSYVLTPVAELKLGPDEQIMVISDITFILNPIRDNLALNGITIDYKADDFTQGLQFINPNATAWCGCGESFRVEK